MVLSLQIAIRFILKSKWQSIFIIFGIAVGISVAIFISILIDSLQYTLINGTIGNAPHITITTDNNKIDNYGALTPKIETVAGITKVYPVVDGNGLLVTQNKNYPVLLRGVNLDKVNDIYQLADRTIEGNGPSSENEVMIGKDLSVTTGSKIGDNITFAQANGNKSTLRVSGIYDLKIATVNSSWIFTNLATAWRILGNEGSYTAVNIQVKDIFKADKTGTLVKDQIGSDYKVDNWKTQNAQLLAGLQGQSTSSYMIQIFVLISVLISIASILSISVTQKSKQIGILKAIGLKNGQSSNIFYYQGFILGLFGTILGVILGLGLFYAFVTFAKTPDGGKIVEPLIRWNMVLVTGIIALAVSSFAGIFPARKANKLSPIEVIRNG